MQRAEHLISEYIGLWADVIILPEKALVGSSFDSMEDVLAIADEAPQDVEEIVVKADIHEGDINSKNLWIKLGESDMLNTFVWAMAVSKRLGGNTWISLGFIEKDQNDQCFNSSMHVNYSLKEIHVIRKT